MEDWYQLQDNHVILHLKIQPQARTTAFMEVMGSHRKMAIKAPPREGEANAELVRFIAKIFKLPQKEVQIIRGVASRIKTVKIPLNDAVKQFLIRKVD